jgi:hypothetical protein
MTVAELIERLSRFPAELEVRIEFDIPLEHGGSMLDGIHTSGVRLDSSMFPGHPMVTIH